MSTSGQCGTQSVSEKPWSLVRILFYAGVVLFAVLFGMASYYYPLKADDYHYLYNIIPGTDAHHVFSEDCVSNWKELVASIYNHRFMQYYNGRLANSVFQIYLFATGGGKLLFSLLNILFLGSFLYLSQKLCLGKVTMAGTAVSLLLGCAYVPDVATVFWMAASCNYLWGCTFFLTFLICLQRVLDANETSKWYFAAGLGSGFIVGWWHEAMGAALCSGMVILYILRWGKCSRSYIWYGLALFLGSLLVLSPGMFERMDSGDTSPPLYRLLHLLYNAKEPCLQFLPVPLAGLAISMVIGRFDIVRRFRDIPLWSMLPFYMALCLAFAWKGSCGGACGFFYPVLLLMLLTMKSLDGICLRMPRWLSLFFVYAGCAGMVATLAYIHKTRCTFDRVMALCDQRPGDEVIVYDESGGERFVAGQWFYAFRRSASLFKQVGPFYGRQRFHLLLDRHPQERTHYADAQWRQCGWEGFSYYERAGNMVIRFPRALYAADGECGVTCTRGDTCTHLQSVVWGVGALDAFAKYDPGALCSYDCDESYYYLLLPGMEGCTQVKCSVEPRDGKARVQVLLRMR